METADSARFCILQYTKNAFNRVQRYDKILSLPSVEEKKRGN